MGQAIDRSRKRVGRPRILTTERVLDAALELGLDGLTMRALARQLGVSIGILYGYVSDREELIQLAAARAIQDHAYPDDVGQNWSVYAAQHVVAWIKFFTGPGDFFLRYVLGKSGPAVEIDLAREWIDALCARGFSIRQALTLQRQMGDIVLGALARRLHYRSTSERGDPLLRALAARDRPDDFELEAHLREAQRPVWAETLQVLFRATSADLNLAFDEAEVGQVLEIALHAWSRPDGVRP
jgi:AcrR family transcriptional regulator